MRDVWSTPVAPFASCTCRAILGTMQNNPTYDDVVHEVGASLEDVKMELVQRGHPEELIVLDPGIGFGKTQSHNLALLKAGKHLVKTEGPLLWGVSRKSVVGHLTGQDEAVNACTAPSVWQPWP